MAPPLAPWNTRLAISIGVFHARPHSSDENAKRAVEIRKTRLRPNRSASVPVAMSTETQAMV